MRTSTAFAFAAASLFSQVSATIYVTQPVATTTCAANTPCTVAWNDDGNAPALATIGACSIDLCTGGVDQQTCLQNISPSLDVSQNAQVSYTVNPSIGANGNMWFVKFTSLAYKDPTNPQFAFTAFSAKYTLTGMTGTFNATVSSEIAGASVAAGAPAAATTVAAAATTPASSSGVVTVKATSTSAGTAKATSSGAKSTSTASSSAAGAVSVVNSFAGVSMVVSLAGLAVGAAALGF